MQQKARSLGLSWRGPVEMKIPTVARPIGELVGDLALGFERRNARGEAKAGGVEIQLEDDGPYGLLFVGDPHLGDAGCDIERLAYTLKLASETPHLHAICMGDLANFWIGRLGHLYRHQTTTDDEEIELCRWLLDGSGVKWSFCVLGNHDKWSPVAELLCKQYGVPYASHGAKLLFKPTSGAVVKLDVRHSHRGNSQFNPSHAQLKRAYRGSDCDIIVGAHTHTSAATVVRNGVTGKLSHAIRVGTYKRWDEYADANHFEDDDIGPAWLAVCDPQAGEEGRVTGFWDIDKGVEYLALLRTPTR